jgi:hypothetical protein
VREKGEKWVVSHGKILEKQFWIGRKNIIRLAFEVHFSVG